MQRCPVELVEAGERGSIGYEGEDTLVLGCGSSVVEGRVTILVTSVDVGEPNHVQDHINAFDVTVGKKSEECAVCIYYIKNECSNLDNHTAM